MERRFSQDLCRNSSEEIFLKSLMENTTPTSMEMLGFRNLSQNHNFRVDSEELFNSWLTHGENNNANGYNSTNIAQRTRQASRRLSTELAALNTHHVLPMVDDFSTHHNHQSLSLRNTMEKGMQATNLYIAKAWFHSSQPMTRSRSSELRRRYAATQTCQTSIGMEATRDASGKDTNRMKQLGGAATTLVENPKQLETFMSPSSSSTCPFSTPVDAVSSVVDMLKGTLERKKLSGHMDTQTDEGCWFELYASQEALPEGPPNHNFVPSGNLQVLPSLLAKDSQTLQVVNDPIHAVSCEPSQSESSAAAPVLSTGIMEVCDGPLSSALTPSVSETSRKQLGNGSLEYSSKAKADIRERILDNNLKDDRKKGSLLRMGSVTSVDKGDPTKKRRVERSRKMAEAKERFMTPTVSLDMQSTLKRCENLEKEVRSLKLNLSFMNRKDSEQTKQIEDLQKQNEELVDEKERLLEEIERILSETANM